MNIVMLVRSLCAFSEAAVLKIDLAGISLPPKSGFPIYCLEAENCQGGLYYELGLNLMKELETSSSFPEAWSSSVVHPNTIVLECGLGVCGQGFV